MILRFDSFQVDPVDERLWREAEPIHLTRKAWGVLRALVESNGRLVTKEQLVQTVWSGTAVGDDSLTKAVRELRRALGDDQRAPRFIATVHGRGYRFVAPLESPATASPSRTAEVAPPLIGRTQELATLRSWLNDVQQGRRQVGVVSGDVGNGKSRLVTAFLDAVLHDPALNLHVAVGRCVEQYGETEPFLPVIGALRRLVRSPSAAAIMRAAAPPWLATACGLSPGSVAADENIGTHAGVLRILAEVVEAIADQAPLALLLEDLHWSDPSTLDLINLLARRTDPARLLVLCTVRYSQALGAGHPSALLVRELRRSEHCREITLAPFTPDEVDRYLAARLDDEPPLRAAEYLLRHTGGNPFFLRALVDDLLARSSLRHERKGWALHAEANPTIPSQSLAALAPRLERLSDSERTMLEAASVIGDTFSASTIAAVLEDKTAIETVLEDIEVVCDRLVRHQDILRTGEDRAPYGFQHALYRQALYEGIPRARLRRIHRAVAEWLVRERSADRSEGAAELAEHFGRAGDHAQAASYHAEAAFAARIRYADREVAAQLAAALTHLRLSPHSTDRDLQELMLIQQHATATIAISGYGDPAIGEDIERAQALARRLEVPLGVYITTAGLFFLRLMRAELDAAATLADELVTVAPSLSLPECVVGADMATAAVLFSRGDLIGARRLLDTSRGRLPRRSLGFAFDAAVWQLSLRAMVYADLGHARVARATVAEMLATAAADTAADVAAAHMLAAGVEAQLRNPTLVLEHVNAATRVPADDRSSVLLAAAGQLRGWASATLGDSAGARAAYADHGVPLRTIGQRLGIPLFASLRSEGALCDNDLVTAHASIRFGLEHATATGEHRLDSELHRLRAQCLGRTGKMEQAATAIATALRIAAEQGARLAELRAAIDNVQLHCSGNSHAAAAQRLATVAESFDPDEPLPELSVASNLLRGDFSAA